MQLIRDGVEVGKRSDQFFRAVAELKRLGWTIDEIARLFEKYPEGIAAKYADRIRGEVDRAYRKVEERGPISEGVSLDDFYA
jgi:hypothetical protein